MDNTEGKFCEYRDYAALAAELDKWREEHSQLVYENKVIFPTRIGVLQKGLADAAAENERLNHKLSRLLGAEQQWELVEPCEYARLKAEVERLRKGWDSSKQLLHKWVARENKRHAKAQKKKR